jgi:hypothetical protein
VQEWRTSDVIEKKLRVQLEITQVEVSWLSGDSWDLCFFFRESGYPGFFAPFKWFFSFTQCHANYASVPILGSHFQFRVVKTIGSQSMFCQINWHAINESSISDLNSFWLRWGVFDWSARSTTFSIPHTLGPYETPTVKTGGDDQALFKRDWFHQVWGIE